MAHWRTRVEQLSNAFAESYRTDLVKSMRHVELRKVSRAIELFLDARAQGRRIFVCGSGVVAVTGAKLLCEGLRNASSQQPMRFRVMMLDDQKPNSIEGSAESVAAERAFVEQLKTHAEPGDLVVALSSRQEFHDVLRALDYAEWIGCPTIAITRAGHKAYPPSASRVAIDLHHDDQASREAVQLVICHMIGRYFSQREGPAFMSC